MVLALLLSGCGEGADSGGRHGSSDAKVPTARLLGTVRGSSDGRSPAPEHSFWADDRQFARASGDSVTGYRTSDAKRKWSLSLGGRICGSSKDRSDDDKVAVVYEGAKDDSGDRYCTEIAAIDLHTGEKLWHRKRSRRDGVEGGATIAVVGNTVVAPGSRGRNAWRLRDGKPLWRKERRHCLDRSYGGARGAGQLVAVGTCLHDPDYVEGLDPRTGRTKFRTRTGGLRGVRILLTDPVVLVGFQRGSGSRAVALTKGGHVRSRFPVHSDPAALVVSHDTLYDEGSGKKSAHNGASLRGIDLDTGKVKGEADFGKQSLRPIRMQGGKLLAYAGPPLRSVNHPQGGSVVSVHPKTFKTTEIMRIHGKSATVEREMAGGNVRFHGGRLLMDQPMAASADLPYSTLVFGRT